jgi:hypothetical protein
MTLPSKEGNKAGHCGRFWHLEHIKSGAQNVYSWQ